MLVIKEFLHKHLPPRLKRWLKKFFRKNNIGGEMFNDTYNRNTPLDGISEKFISRLFSYLDRNISVLLQVREIRQLLARERLTQFLENSEIKKTDKEPTQNAHNTMNYNIQGLIESVEIDRPSILINPVLSIEKIFKNVKNMRVLSIGPRSEIEIFSLFSNGFKLENIKAVDLFSYSPYVEIGDMHNLPYPDNSFDVILLGWVLSYSKDWETVAREITRCCSKGGVVAIAADYSDISTVTDLFNHESTHVQCCDQILELFTSNLGQVYFRHESTHPSTSMNMVVFELDKKL